MEIINGKVIMRDFDINDINSYYDIAELLVECKYTMERLNATQGDTENLVDEMIENLKGYNSVYGLNEVLQTITDIMRQSCDYLYYPTILTSALSDMHDAINAGKSITKELDTLKSINFDNAYEIEFQILFTQQLTNVLEQGDIPRVVSGGRPLHYDIIQLQEYVPINTLKYIAYIASSANINNSIEHLIVEYQNDILSEWGREIICEEQMITLSDAISGLAIRTDEAFLDLIESEFNIKEL